MMSSTQPQRALRGLVVSAIIGMVDATAVTAAVVLSGTVNRAEPPLAVALTSDEAIDIAQGISISRAWLDAWKPGTGLGCAQQRRRQRAAASRGKASRPDGCRRRIAGRHESVHVIGRSGQREGLVRA